MSSMGDAGVGDSGSPASDAGNASMMSPSSPGELWKPRIDPALAERNYVILESQPGDSIGGGKMFAYDNQNSFIEVKASGNTLSVRVVGDEHWLGSFEASGAGRELVAGYYGDLRRPQAMTSGLGGLVWSKLIGHGFSSCDSLSGWFAIDAIDRDGDALTKLALRFQITCSGASASLRGAVQWLASDKTYPPDPPPVPDNLWRAPSASVPQGVNYAYFVSEPNDIVGQGGTYLYTQSIAFFKLFPTSWQLSLYIGGAKNSWTGSFAANLREGRLVPGYYHTVDGGLNPARGGAVVLRGDPGGELSGWFALDQVTYEGDELTAFDLRFEQHSNAVKDALRGQIHWRADDPSHLPTPIDPPPADLWRPAAGATPTGLNYLYLQSEAGDDIGAGGTYTLTQMNSRLKVGHSPQELWVSAETETLWSGDFWLGEYERIQPGYYGPRARGPDLPQLGSMTFSGIRACTISGAAWFAVDHVEYAADKLTALDLRFEQHCMFASNPALHGELHWRYDDPSKPPGPVSPPPAALWRAPAEAVPTSGNYLLLRSEPGEFVLSGASRDYMGEMKVNGPGIVLDVTADDCLGTFLGMYQLERLVEGYYGGLRGYGGSNPAIGGLSFYCGGRRCDEPRGWFVVDEINYENGWIKALDLRFEQFCKSETVALHGQIHYQAP